MPLPIIFQFSNTRSRRTEWQFLLLTYSVVKTSIWYYSLGELFKAAGYMKNKLILRSAQSISFMATWACAVLLIT